MGESFLSFPILDDTKRFTVVRTNKELLSVAIIRSCTLVGRGFLFLFAFYSHRFGYPCGEERFT